MHIGVVRSLFLALGLTLAAVTPAQAISINTVAGPEAALALGAPIGAVVSLNRTGGGQPNFCTGVVISANHIATAAHCFGSENNLNFTVRETQGDGTLIEEHSVVGFTLFPSLVPNPETEDYFTGFDLAVVEISSTFNAAPLSFAPEVYVGQQALIVGYGNNGEPGGDPINTDDGTRWGAENIIDAIGPGALLEPGTANLISMDFDDPLDVLGDGNQIGSPLALLNEGLVAGGDSGGPLLVNHGGEWVIGGLLTGGTPPLGQYGALGFWTEINRPEVEAFFTEFGAQYASPIPLPAGAWMLLAGLGALMGLRRTRRRA